MRITLSKLTPAQAKVRQERLRCQRYLDEIRIGTARLLHAGWNAPRLQALGVPLSVVFRVGNEANRIIRRPGVCADLRMTEAEAVWLIENAQRWLPEARRDFRAAAARQQADPDPRDSTLLHAARIIVEAAAVLAGLESPIPMAHPPAERLFCASQVFRFRARRADWPAIYAVLQAYGEGDDDALRASIPAAYKALGLSQNRAERAAALLANDGAQRMRAAE